MDRAIGRFVDAIDRTAAMFLAAVTALTFVSVFLRYLFAWSIPDSYDISAQLLGILIFWGIAGTSYRGDHITVDLIWSVVPKGARHALDVFANAVTLAAIAVLTWMMAEKVLSTRADQVRTFDTGLPVWVFYLVAWLGLAAAVLLTLIRFVRLVLRPEAVDTAHHAASGE